MAKSQNVDGEYDLLLNLTVVLYSNALWTCCVTSPTCDQSKLLPTTRAQFFLFCFFNKLYYQKMTNKTGSKETTVIHSGTCPQCAAELPDVIIQTYLDNFYRAMRSEQYPAICIL